MKTVIQLVMLFVFMIGTTGCSICEPTCGYSPFDIVPAGGYPLNATGFQGCGCVDSCTPQCAAPEVGCVVEPYADSGCAVDSCGPVACAPQRKCCRPKMKFPSFPKHLFKKHTRKNDCGCSAPQIHSAKPTCACPVSSDSYCADCGPSTVPSTPTFVPDGKATEPGCEKCQPKDVPPNVSLNFESVPVPPRMQKTYKPVAPAMNDKKVPVPGVSPISDPTEVWQPPSEIQQQSYTVPKIQNIRLVPPEVDALPNGASAWQEKMPIAGQRELPRQIN